jgi:UDP-N-acetylglucosamine 2-epimerase (non-hydrolysing)
VFPVHPRTRQRLRDFALAARLETGSSGAVRLTEPLSYIEFMSLVGDCRFALTDSGGVQEETSYLGIPCLTLRENTERPITVTLGTNRLVTAANLSAEITRVLDAPRRTPSAIPLWDGRTAGRIVADLRRRIGR